MPPISGMLNGFGIADEEDEEVDERNETVVDREKEREALQASRQFFQSISEGKHPITMRDRFYIMPLSGRSGRMMVRGWMEGSYEELYRNISLWFEDLRIIRPSGLGLTKSPKLKALLIRLLKPGGDPAKAFSRTADELKNLNGRIVEAIIFDYPLPDEVAARALRWLRSSMQQNNDESGKVNPIRTETLAYQLLKAWLRRKQRQRGETVLMEDCVEKSPKTAAYCCGQLMAVYGLLHEKAMPNVNVNVTERYYTSASTTPAFVIGKLAQMSVHHLSKLDARCAGYYRRVLEEVAASIDMEQLPKSLSMEQQTEFALGYYQQRAGMLRRTPRVDGGSNQSTL